VSNLTPAARAAQNIQSHGDDFGKVQVLGYLVPSTLVP
jgi:hypothetical protein